jgi:hypothetical protein
MIGPWILKKIQKRRERLEAQQDAAQDGSAARRRPPRRGKGRPVPPEELAKNLEQLRGLCFCVLYDLCCWMAGARQEVPESTREYAHVHLRQVVDPRQRLQHYVNPQLLAMWERALEPFFTTGLRLAPELGDSATLREEGLERGEPVRVELHFKNRSSVVARDLPRQPLPRSEWVLTLWVAPDLSRVDDGTLRPLQGGDD